MVFENICDPVLHFARVAPEKEASCFNGERLSYADLAEKIRRFAAYLQTAGMKVGDRVAMIAPPCNDFLVVYYGTVLAGGIFVGINPKMQIPELRFLISDCEPFLLACPGSFDGKDFGDALTAVRSEHNELLIVEAYTRGELTDQGACDLPAVLEASKTNCAEFRPKTSDPALIVYTSGTTGKPKGALLSHGNVIASISAETEAFEIGKNSRVLVHMPVSHIACSIELTAAAFFVGASVVFLARFTPDGTLQAVQDEKITVLGQVPTMFILELRLPDFARYDLSSLESIAWAGAAAPVELVRKLASLGKRLATGYGMTEAAGFVTYSAEDDDVETLARTAGRCHPNFELRVVDPAREKLAEGGIGEIEIRGDCVGLGYFRNEKATAEVFHEDGWYSTGDLGFLDERGYVTIVGRAKEMFKSGGENVYPREIEAALEEMPDVALAAVVPKSDTVFQEVGVAFVVLKTDAATEDDLRKHCEKMLAPYKVPKEFRIARNLPMLATGKIDKKALQSQV
ncbi:MAG: acyl--CoA ligase [Planctomycetes bacterium]|nr:acyl--CoA ligase [Planctomycetota bacterium]